MKKAFMRGVCALNIEALSMFNTGEVGRLDHGKMIDGFSKITVEIITFIRM